MVAVEASSPMCVADNMFGTMLRASLKTKELGFRRKVRVKHFQRVDPER